MKVKTSYIPIVCDYLTVGKEYEVFDIRQDGAVGNVFDDTGKTIVLRFAMCAHLAGKAWEVVS